MSSTVQTVSVSQKALWAGRILTAVAALFMVFDGAVKVMKLAPAVKGTAQLGYPESLLPEIGILLLVFTALYLIPRTSILGAILLSGYLGGATASQLRIGSPLFETLFPILFGVLIWAALYLRDGRLRTAVRPCS